MKQHRWLVALFVVALLQCAWLAQGMQLWDDDYTHWLRPALTRPTLSLVADVLSPVSTRPEAWGFDERPLNTLLFWACYQLGGYDPRIFFALHALGLAVCTIMVALWGRRLGANRRGAAAAALLFLCGSGPLSAYLILADCSPLSQAWMLVTGWLLLNAVEHRASTGRWAALVVLTYLGYKLKGEIKLLPAIVLLYVAWQRRDQLRRVVFPVAAMVLLALPWSLQLFSHVPPFIPGGKPAPESWMFQAASTRRWREFFWSGQTVGWQPLDPTLSLLGMLGPFGLLAAALGWSGSRGGRSTAAFHFLLVWLAVSCLSLTALPELNYSYRIRYGIFLMTPVCCLLAPALGSGPGWRQALTLLLLFAQCLLGEARGARLRAGLGRLGVQVHSCYSWLAEHDPQARLGLAPDFLPFDFRPDAPAVITGKQPLRRFEDVAALGRGAYLLSWNCPLWEQLELVRADDGARDGVLVDRWLPPDGRHTLYLLRFIGPDPRFASALRARPADAVPAFQAMLRAHPDNLAVRFQLGVALCNLKRFSEACEIFKRVAEVQPDLWSAHYNYALALEGCQQTAHARIEVERAHELAPGLPLVTTAWQRLSGRAPAQADLPR